MSYCCRLVFILLCCALVGCASSSNPSGAKKLRIAVIPKGTSHEFWKSVEAGVRKAADEFSDIDVIWKGPLSEGQTAAQIDMVESFVADGYDGICVAPLDAIALRRPIEQAQAAGTKVVLFDSGLEDASGVVSYVATNNFRGGQQAGEYLAKLLEGQGKVILMRYDLNSESTNQRERGFLEALTPHAGIELLSSDKFGGPDESKAIELAENLVSTYGDQIQGIFCPNESTAAGTLTAFKRAGLAGKVKLIGFDSGPRIAAGLEQGEVHGTILQDPVQMGYDAVRVMRDHLQGRPVPERIETQEVLATTENCREPEIRALLFPAAAR
jgi:ribose transport system substrate-binding protein